MASGEQAAPFLLAVGAEQQARRGGRGRFPSLVACATAGMNVAFIGEMGHGREWVPRDGFVGTRCWNYTNVITDIYTYRCLNPQPCHVEFDIFGACQLG
ncbi:unnamed protein product [Miscanthus lutarioriparius]|uniref:Uncharacterized protein n=1 Tax=Miscanthus lutarioriparius TaxID=422564 RepID=A0A811QBN5_9POAL|nr:unnamed protein product [Miscanthus lutarioriparius]